jgi:hypothetical protein
MSPTMNLMTMNLMTTSFGDDGDGDGGVLSVRSVYLDCLGYQPW